jgi:5-methylcytosine-specific restriction protein A
VKRTSLTRKAPLDSGTKGLQRTGISRTSTLGRGTGMPRSALPCPSPAPKAKKPAAGRAPMPKWLADYVLERADWCCDWCGQSIVGQPFSRQHRRAHGSGGRAGGELHTAANVIVLCGSATSPGCHNRAENQGRALAYRLGFAIRGEARAPEEVPIFRHEREWVIPTAYGWRPAEPPAT